MRAEATVCSLFAFVDGRQQCARAGNATTLALTNWLAPECRVTVTPEDIHLHHASWISPERTSILRASPGCHQLPSQLRRACGLEVRDSALHPHSSRNRQPPTHHPRPGTASKHGGRDQPRHVSRRTIHSLRQQPASKEQQMQRLLAPMLVDQWTTRRRSHDGRAHSASAEPTAAVLPYSQHALGDTPVCATRARTVAQLPEILN